MPWTHLTADICRLAYLLVESIVKEQHGRDPSASKNGRRRKSRPASGSTQRRHAKIQATATVEAEIQDDDMSAAQADK